MTAFNKVIMFLLCLTIGGLLYNPIGNVKAQVNAFDSGILVLTDSIVDVTTSDLWVRVISCTNTSSSAATLTIEDGDNTDYFTAVSIAANSSMVANYGNGVKFNDGLSWGSGTASVINCQVEGRSN